MYRMQWMEWKSLNTKIGEMKIPEKVSGFTIRNSSQKCGRNKKCHCGSGLKFKKCCL